MNEQIYLEKAYQYSQGSCSTSHVTAARKEIPWSNIELADKRFQQETVGGAPILERFPLTWNRSSFVCEQIHAMWIAFGDST